MPTFYWHHCDLVVITTVVDFLTIIFTRSNSLQFLSTSRQKYQTQELRIFTPSLLWEKLKTMLNYCYYHPIYDLSFLYVPWHPKNFLIYWIWLSNWFMICGGFLKQSKYHVFVFEFKYYCTIFILYNIQSF